ncbi:MAG: polysaccharide biosynthesis/export family protein [Flavobacteriia bacterium]|jgi:polysaccharide export outer membrane protein
MRYYKLTFNSFYFLITSILIASCGVNSNIMFKTPKGVDYKYDSIPMKPAEEYKISKDDKIAFTISNNLGHKIIDNQTGVGGVNPTAMNAKEMEYIVKNDGFTELPVIGNVHVEGLTITQCQDTLAKKYAKEHQSPFVQVRVTNQRVIVFPGEGSDAKVIPLTNTNTTLMETIAQAGGITDRGKANTIKLMRKINGKREIYLIDLSTIDGLKYTDMIVQSNDYIYVEPDPRIARETLAQITPFVTILSSLAIVLTVLNRQ